MSDDFGMSAMRENVDICPGQLWKEARGADRLIMVTSVGDKVGIRSVNIFNDGVHPEVVGVGTQSHIRRDRFLSGFYLMVQRPRINECVKRYCWGRI